MSAWTETNANGLRKRVPLSEAFIEAFPEETPVLTAIPKKTGCKTTSPDSNSSKVEWLWKKFRPGRNRPTYDGDDIDDAEAENNEDNKTYIEGRIQLIRSVVKTGRITQAVFQQHGVKKPIHEDHVADALRGMRADKELILMSEADSRAQTSSPKAGYQTRGFASWARTGAHTDLPVPTMARIPTAQVKSISAVTDFDESSLNDMLESCWQTRKTPGNWHMQGTSGLQRVIDNWLCFGEQSSTSLPIRRYNNDASTGEIKLSVRSYKGTFGAVHFSPHTALPTTQTMDVTTTNTSTTVTVADNRGLYAGMPISGTGIPANSRISAVPPPATSTTLIYISAAATASGTVTGTIGETVFAELWDFDFVELGYVEEVGWKDLEDKGGGPRGYADALFFLANLNPQAHAIVRKS